MMTPVAILEQATDLGVELAVADGLLVGRPASQLTPELRRAIWANGDELKTLLSQPGKACRELWRAALEDVRQAWHSHGGTDRPSWDDTGLTDAVGSAIRRGIVRETRTATVRWRLAWEEALSGDLRSGSRKRLNHGEK